MFFRIPTSTRIQRVRDGTPIEEYPIGEAIYSMAHLEPEKPAGAFGLDIHVVSLLEPTLTEKKLEMLFTNIPARCILLFEDTDTTGLIREPTHADEKNAVSTKANQLSEEEKKKGISLSGLNIVDGVFAFPNTTKSQIREPFKRMCSNDCRAPRRSSFRLLLLRRVHYRLLRS